jgi:hypothetical protein
MDMVDMAREMPAVAGVPEMGEASVYPCCLTLNLDMEALEALGVDPLPTAGTEFHLEAHGVITHSSTSDPDADGDVDGANLTLQVKHLGFEHEAEPPLKDTDHDRAGRMYGPRGA